MPAHVTPRAFDVVFNNKAVPVHTANDTEANEDDEMTFVLMLSRALWQEC